MISCRNYFFAIAAAFFCFGKIHGQTDASAPKPIVLIYSDATQTVYFVSTGQEYTGRDVISTVYDLSGRVEEETNILGGASYGIFVGNLSTGIYFVQVKTGEEVIGNQKIIVQHKD